MNKLEFIEQLKQSLHGEIPAYEINKHVNYYSEYITEGPESVENKLEELGDPRLIAKTIIDTYTLTHPTTESAQEQYYEEDVEEYADDNENDNMMNNKNMKILMSGKIPLSWKIYGIIALIVLIILLVIIGGFVLRFGLPILLVICLFQLIRGMKNR